MNLRRFRIVRQIAARPRLAISAVVGLLTVALLPHSWAPHAITRLIIGWNVGAILYIVLATIMMTRSSKETMQRRACAQDDGQFVILVLVVLAAVMSLAAIIAELAIAKEMHGELKLVHIALAVLTIISSWAFTHIMFALHYAHDYYDEIRRGRPGGMEFPGTTEPLYSDFLYAAFIIGTSGQTADVSFSTSTLRKVALVHSVLAFVFNTTLLAMTINVAAGLF